MATTREHILAAISTAVGGESEQGQHDLLICWANTSEADHAHRCVLAHYLAELETDLAAEVDWDEQALASFAHVSDADLTPVGIPAAAGLTPSMQLNLGDSLQERLSTQP